MNPSEQKTALLAPERSPVHLSSLSEYLSVPGALSMDEAPLSDISHSETIPDALKEDAPEASIYILAARTVPHCRLAAPERSTIILSVTSISQMTSDAPLAETEKDVPVNGTPEEKEDAPETDTVLTPFL